MAETQRLDKWLWFARVVKTRTLAARLVASGHVRLNSRRIEAPSKTVAPGDVLTIALERQVRVLKVRQPGTRRGAYPEARLLFEELSGAAEAEEFASRNMP
jgi:ribosome-associated heat shock protein Hsp15